MYGQAMSEVTHRCTQYTVNSSWTPDAALLKFQQDVWLLLVVRTATRAVFKSSQALFSLVTLPPMSHSATYRLPSASTANP